MHDYDKEEHFKNFKKNFTKKNSENNSEYYSVYICSVETKMERVW